MIAAKHTRPVYWRHRLGRGAALCWGYQGGPDRVGHHDTSAAWLTGCRSVAPPETERLWTELADRQAELEGVLSAHRSALAATAEAGQPGPALAQLEAHVQTQQPERARETQRRLQQIAEQLSGRLAPDAAQQLQTQVG